MWVWVLVSSAISYVVKLAGYLVPPEPLQRDRVRHAAAQLTVGLLASLVMINTFGAGQGLAVDARLVALAVAVVALLLRAPFLLVVVLGAIAAALARALGWG